MVMQLNQSQTAQPINTLASPISQTINPDYTGIYAFCGTILFLGIIFYCIIYKISEKWRVDNYKLRQLAIEKNGEENIRLLKKLDKVLEILTKNGYDK